MKKKLIKFQPVKIFGSVLDTLIIINTGSVIEETATTVKATFIAFDSSTVKEKQPLNIMQLDGYKAINYVVNNCKEQTLEAVEAALIQQLGITII